MFSEATLLQDLTSALTAILHPNAYLEVYPVRGPSASTRVGFEPALALTLRWVYIVQLGSFQGMEDIAEAVHLLFRPAANRRWVTLERNGTSMVTSSSTANLWVVEDVVDADSTLAQTLPDLLKEDAPPAPAQLAVRGVLRQRVQFGTCGALIGSVTLELPTGLAKRLLDNRSPLCAPSSPSPSRDVARCCCSDAPLSPQEGHLRCRNRRVLPGRATRWWHGRGADALGAHQRRVRVRRRHRRRRATLQPRGVRAGACYIPTERCHPTQVYMHTRPPRTLNCSRGLRGPEPSPYNWPSRCSGGGVVRRPSGALRPRGQSLRIQRGVPNERAWEDRDEARPHLQLRLPQQHAGGTQPDEVLHALDDGPSPEPRWSRIRDIRLPQPARHVRGVLPRRDRLNAGWAQATVLTLSEP
jgi:hypothetical protein